MGSTFDQNEIKNGNGLVCPYYKMDPVKYEKHNVCHSTNTKAWAVKDVTQHLWRCHSPRFHCPYCMARWPSVTHKKIDEVREHHVLGCPGKIALDGKKWVRKADEIDIMTEEQQKAFEEVKKIRGDNRRKLEMLYRALGFGDRLPETYHMHPFDPVADAQHLEMTYPVPDAQEFERCILQKADRMNYQPPNRTGSSGGGFMQGLTPPEILDPNLPIPSGIPPSRKDIGKASADFEFSGSTCVVPSGSTQVPDPARLDSGYEGSEGMDKRVVEAQENHGEIQSLSSFTSPWLPWEGMESRDSNGEIDVNDPPSELDSDDLVKQHGENCWNWSDLLR